MRRTLFIVIGIIVLLLIIGVWIYLIVFGVPQSADDVFTNFNFDTNEPAFAPLPEPDPEPEPEPEPTTDVADPMALRQLTTDPVAGYVALYSTSSDRVRYVERGTGHVYDLDLTSGETERVSGTTIARTTEATFSPDGSVVALTSETTYDRSGVIGRINTTTKTLSGAETPPNPFDFHVTNDNRVSFGVPSANGTQIFTFDPNTTTSEAGPELPFKDIRLIFDADTAYFYNRPDDTVKGTMYRITDNWFTSEGVAEYGFTTLKQGEYAVLSYVDRSANTLVSAVQTNPTAGPNQLGILTLPEKCTFDSLLPDRMWCGAPAGDMPRDFLTDWYQGVVTSVDALWEIDLDAQTAYLVSIPNSDVGRTIDITNLIMSDNNEALFFTNKIDGTLWMYDLSL